MNNVPRHSDKRHNKVTARQLEVLAMYSYCGTSLSINYIATELKITSSSARQMYWILVDKELITVTGQVTDRSERALRGEL